MQIAVIEFSRHVAGFADAHSSEFDPATGHPVIALMKGNQKSTVVFSHRTGIMIGGHFSVSFGTIRPPAAHSPGGIMTPTYEPFWGAAQFNHLACVCSDLLEKDGYYTIDFDDFERKAADPAVKVCLFCNPHNPSGRVWSQDELRRVGDICLRNGLWLISDEIHCDLLRTGLRHTPLASLFPDSGHIITCMAPSKTFNIAGLHFSNIIIPDEALRKKWMINHDGNENPLSMAAALAAYRDGYDWMMALRGYLDGNLVYLKEFLSENLPKAVYRVPEATYLAWVDLGAYVAPGTDLVKFFASKAGVLLEAGDSFIRNAGTFVRLNIACPRSMTMRAVMAGLAKFLPMPPKSILTATMATRQPNTACHRGIDTGRLNARSMVTVVPSTETFSQPTSASSSSISDASGTR